MDRLLAMEMFVRVVETGSFSKAAREFNTTQPTVTKQVAATEARLRARLLNRNTRGVSLTEAGALYYEKCKTIVREAEEAESIVQAAAVAGAGPAARSAPRSPSAAAWWCRWRSNSWPGIRRCRST